jgi:hypothetical protein
MTSHARTTTPASVTAASRTSGVVVQRKCKCGSGKGKKGETCDECKPHKVQTQLSISSPGDRFEREADRIADQVVSRSEGMSAINAAPVQVQRLTGDPDAAGSPAPASLDRALAGPSTGMAPSVLAHMEQRFGHDFSGVRIHTGATAQDSARELNADAYTVGRDVVFGAGQYAPETHRGRRLIAHELTHVVQQSSAPAAPASNRRTVFRHAAGAGKCLNDPDWKRIDATPQTVWGPANDAIERSYKDSHSSHAILTGSQFEYGGKPGSSGIQLPKGAPHKKSGDKLLKHFLGVSRQLAPDVVDFTDRVFYEIKTNQYAKEGAGQVLSYYKTINAIAVAEGEPTWQIDAASWYPPHILMLEPTRRVCTEGTDYQRTQRPGLIIYEVQDHKDRKKRKEEEEKQKEADDAKKAQDAAAAAAAAALNRKKLQKVKEFVDALQREVDMSEGEHILQRRLINEPSYFGFWGYWTNELFSEQPPLQMIWDPVHHAISAARIQLKAGNAQRALARFVEGRLAYIKALNTYMDWREKLPGAGAKMQTAIVVSAVLALAAFVAPTVVAHAARGASATSGTAANLAAAQQAVGQAGVRIAAGEAQMAAIEASIVEMEIVTAAELEAEMIVLRMLTF